MSETSAMRPPDGTLAPIRARREALEIAASELQQSLAVASATSQWRDGVRAALGRTQAVLEEHLRTSEGATGLTAAVIKADARLSGPAERLASEHADLVEAQHAVSELAADAASEPDDIRDAAAAFVTLILRHLQHAHDLLHDAIESELGGGD